MSSPAINFKDKVRSKHRLRLWVQMLKTTRHLESALREKMREEFASTLPRFDVLAMLDKSGEGLRMSALSRELMVSNGNVTALVDRLVEDGLVARVAIPGDRRATLVQLTDAGRTAFNAMARTHELWVEELLDGVTGGEIDQCLETFGKIRKAET